MFHPTTKMTNNDFYFGKISFIMSICTYIRLPAVNLNCRLCSTNEFEYRKVVTH